VYANLTALQALFPVEPALGVLILLALVAGLVLRMAVYLDLELRRGGKAR
jgi:hypothetical protein